MTGLTEGIVTRTLGCRLNALESAIMAENARAAGVGNAVIVNTCAVTAEAVRQSRQAVRRARRDHPEARVIVTGCAAHIDPKVFSAMPEADELIGNDMKTSPEAFSARGSARAERRGAAHGVARSSGVVRRDGCARAYVQIQAGCDHACTFCVIPRGRGAAVSAPAREIIDEVRELVDAGYREVVLTGVDIASWGQDLPGADDLGHLVCGILQSEPRLFLLRLSSLDPHRISDTLVRAFAGQERLAPYAHLSMQAGHDMILKRMRRRHSRAEAVAIATALRRVRPEIALGADLIAGFPTETDEMFAATMSLIDDCGLDHLHVFPFSAHLDTAAARMPQVEKQVIGRRARCLRHRGVQRLQARLDRHVGRRVRVVVGGSDKVRLADYAPALLSFRPVGPVAEVRLTRRRGLVLIAEAA